MELLLLLFDNFSGDYYFKITNVSYAIYSGYLGFMSSSISSLFIKAYTEYFLR